jgi:hypothetical protein
VFPVNIVERYSGSGVATIDAVAPAELRRPHHWFFLDPLRDLPFWIGTLLTVVYLVFVLVWLRIV